MLSEILPDSSPALSEVTPACDLLIAGGALRASSPVIFQKLVELAAGPIAVLAAASAEPERVARLALADIAAAGGVGRVVHVTADHAADPETLEALSACRGFWFEGGDQRRITAALGTAAAPTRALELIRAQARVIGGTSAGAAAMSDPMIAERESPESLALGAACLEPGLGFVRGAITDQHFIERARFARLLLAMRHTGARVGIGVGEDTALWLPRRGPWRAIGGSSVAVFEVTAQGTVVSLLSQNQPPQPVSSRTDPELLDLLEGNGWQSWVQDFIASGESERSQTLALPGGARWQLRLTKNPAAPAQPYLQLEPLNS